MVRDFQGPRRLGAVMLLSALLAATPAVAGPADVYFERSLIQAADSRCGLFDPVTAGALAAGAAQARGAALRGGVGEAHLNTVLARAAARAASVGCDDADLATIAERVRFAFEAWARTPRMTFPGERSQWSVDRAAYSRQSWRARQAADGVVLGFAGAGTGHTLALTVEDEAVVSARIVVRDPTRAGTAWIARPGMAETPPPSASRVFMAGRARAAPETLSPEGGQLFRFSTAAADAIGAMDPRERFAVELIQADGATRVVTLGVGDFAAARAFLAMGTL